MELTVYPLIYSFRGCFKRRSCIWFTVAARAHADAHLRLPLMQSMGALHAQGNYSDLLVQLSNIYSQLRGDVSGVKNEDSAQGFVRSTTKYWVRMTDVSAVKHHILQHLPVFQYNEGSVRACPLFPPPMSTLYAAEAKQCWQNLHDELRA